MREHIGLFRGKRLSNGKWMQGNLLQYSDGTCCICHAGSRVNHYKVDPTTVGECTGLRDMAGKMIFEGDILEVIRNKARWICFVEDVRNLPTTMFGSAVESIEIIGTTTDNPELLKGGEGA